MRKKWTAKEVLTPELLEFRERRKWQIALRRYVLDQKRTAAYAPFFGADIKTFREWIALQFGPDLGWGDFSSSWQFDHVMPITYFDFGNLDDMRLAWNFTNIRVEAIPTRDKGQQLDLLAAKTYFTRIYERTGYEMSNSMVKKIASIEALQLAGNERQEEFIKEKKTLLDALAGFSAHQYEQINAGVSLNEIAAEQAIISKWG